MTPLPFVDAFQSQYFGRCYFALSISCSSWQKQASFCLTYFIGTCHTSIATKQNAARSRKARQEVSRRRAEEERKRRRPVTPPVDPSLKKVELSEEEKASIRKPPTHVDLGLNFKYFESQQGLKFLLETGCLDPEAKTLINQKAKMPDLDLDQKIKSIWAPALVFEEPDAYLDTTELFENSHADFDYGYERGLEQSLGAQGGEYLISAIGRCAQKNSNSSCLEWDLRVQLLLSQVPLEPARRWRPPAGRRFSPAAEKSQRRRLRALRPW